MRGNPVRCGCEMLALKNWIYPDKPSQQILPALDPEDLKCANVKSGDNDGLPLSDMSVEDFDCDDPDQTIFNEDQACPACSKREVQDLEACGTSIENEECDLEDEDTTVCGTHFIYTKDGVDIEKTCSSYDDCMEKEMLNADKCSIFNILTKLECHFCCLGDLCNDTTFGGRIHLYRFFVTMVIQDGTYDADFDASQRTHLTQMVTSAVLSPFPYILGSFDVHDVSYSGPGLLVHLALKAHLLTQKDVITTKMMIKTTLLKETDNDKSPLSLLNIISVEIFDEAPKFCKTTTQSTIRGTFRWIRIPAGKTIRTRCPHREGEVQGDRILRSASRTCRLTQGAATWMDSNIRQCPFTRETTQRLEDLYNTRITSTNAINVSRSLKELTSETQDFSHEDIDFAVRVVEKIVPLASTATSSELVDNTIATISSLIGAPESVLLESEQKKLSTTRMLRSVNTLSMKVPIKDSTFLVVKPNIAIAALKVQPGTFLGVSFSTDSDDDDTDGGLEVSQVAIIPNGSSSEENNDDDRSTITLPGSIFNSLNSREQASIDRIIFAIYPTDKLFAILEESRQGPSVNPTGRAGLTKPVPSPPTSIGSSSPAVTNTSVVVGTTKAKKGFTRMVNSLIVSASVPQVIVQNLSDPVIIHLPHVRKPSDKYSNANNSECVFWSIIESKWSSEGCWVVKYVPDSYTTCACNHLTNFALLMDVYDGGIKLSDTDRVALSIISYVGCGISLLCLLFTLLTYMMFRKLRRDNPSKILVNLCIALALANVVFLVGLQDYSFADTAGCKVVAVLLHYFLLSALTWMAVEAFYMYLALVLVFNTYFTNFILKCCAIGWGVPLVVVAITLGVNSTDNYGLLSSGICWLRNPAFYISFLAPVGLILVINFAAFGLVLRQILGLSSRKLNKSDKSSVIKQLRGALGVVILLGLTWVFAIFAIDGASLVFNYLFAITNSLQGMFIFIFYCVLKKDALSAWRRKLPCCKPEDDKSSDRSTSKGYSNPSSNSTVKHSISSSNGSNITSSDEVKHRGKAQKYQLSRDSNISGLPVDHRTSTSI